jgi:cation diffusion facilitator CzcD-associated flavoprotein CzcO
MTIKPRHVVLATGLGGGQPRMPKPVPGQDTFPGHITHGFHFDSGKKWKGKKALVVGTSSSGMDIAFDLELNGAEVTMLQRWV